MKLKNDMTLWQLCIMGNHDACEVLYKKYYMLLFNYGRRFVTDMDMVHDVIQDLFVSFLLCEIKQSNITTIESYLLGIYRNKLIDVLKTKNINWEESVFELHEQTLHENASSASNNEDEYKILVRKVFQLLTKKQKEVIYLFYIKECSHQEIAKALNIKEQSSKNMLCRAVLKMRLDFYQETSNSSLGAKFEGTLKIREYEKIG